MSFPHPFLRSLSASFLLVFEYLKKRVASSVLNLKVLFFLLATWLLVEWTAKDNYTVLAMSENL